MNSAEPNEEGGMALVTLELSSTTEVSSAQQHVRVVVVSLIRVRLRFDGRDDLSGDGDGDDDDDGVDARHASISFPMRWSHRAEERTIDDTSGIVGQRHRPPRAFVRMLAVLRRGKNRLVVREWRRGACWWNLNANHMDDSIEGGDCSGRILRGIPRNANDALDADATPPGGEKSAAAHAILSMARAEVSGYRLARLALNHRHREFETPSSTLYGNDSASVDDDYDVGQGEERPKMDMCSLDIHSPRRNARLYIPEVIYFSHDDASESDTTPWALMSYFDNDASNNVEDLPRPLEIEMDDEGRCDDVIFFDDVLNSTNQRDDIHSLTNSTTMLPCYHFQSTMVKTRREFGFDEPHPRHGRVRSDECLDYAKMILRDVVMPIQGYFFALWHDTTNDKHVSETLRFVGCFRADSKQANQTPRPFQYQDMLVVCRHALNRLSKANMGTNEAAKNDGKMDLLLRTLDKCLSALSCEWKDTGGQPPPLPPVLCHMDLQPQNLAFKRDQDCNIRNCRVASVMDWEEACYADPRFEILLICRKVLANREQAESLWQAYSVFIQQLSKSLSLKSPTKVHWTIGDIEPWLKLETVHSLCTLSLQAGDLLGVGRSPWETKQDLWGKIERERQRLVQMGWIFCDCKENDDYEICRNTLCQ